MDVVKHLDDLTFLVVGVDNERLATSARAAGFEVYVADFFGDQSLKRICRVKSVVKQKRYTSCGRVALNYEPDMLLQLAKHLVRNRQVDGVLLSTGLDDYPDTLRGLNDVAPIIGNPPDVFSKVRNVLEVAEELKRLGISHPAVRVAADEGEAVKAAQDIGYPVIVKPVGGFGGMEVRAAGDEVELKKACRIIHSHNGQFQVQEFFPGFAASVSFVSTRSETLLLSVNEQLQGLHAVGQKAPFGYCGNIVPYKLSAQKNSVCTHVVKQVAQKFGLVGSNGVDVVLSEDGKVTVVEVNPRFQGSLECVERAFNINLVKTHVAACRYGVLPQGPKSSSCFCTRLILYARLRSLVPDLTVFKEARDIPFPNVLVEAGEPLCSLVVEGATRLSSFGKAFEKAESIYMMLKSAN